MLSGVLQGVEEGEQAFEVLEVLHHEFGLVVHVHRPERLQASASAARVLHEGELLFGKLGPGGPAEQVGQMGQGHPQGVAPSGGQG